MGLIFNYLHENPEISWEEVNTTNYLRELLEQEGCRIKTFNDCTGLIAEIGNGNPIVSIRADMDALWQEVDGEFTANHSCGHDAHMAMVIGAMYLLQKEPLNGTIRFIFQPAEEKGKGALKMVEKNVIDGAEFLFGVHLRPIQELVHGQATSSIIHGAVRCIEGNIIGDDFHAARPHLGANSIDVGSTISKMLKEIHLNPAVPYSVKMTKFQAGGKNSNIIPGNAQFSIDIRAQENELMSEIQEKIDGIIQAVKVMYKVDIDYQVCSDIPAAVQNKKAQTLMQKAIENVLGTECFVPPIQTTGGDDFHFYTIKRPELKATMLGLGCDLQPGLHHPKMEFNHEVLMDGAKILAEAAKLALQQQA
ncbi:amidohydrolase [Sporosarcina globispora]|uniref:Amidohydrolase n=1 Tax=Sporosarcina globispora TaxID=1459 RepID=A0A0M0GK62_SPOGL|nr:M20 peptidase aminoacylase family protein [Sporosarcina globispora]KON90310.1 amidohydrolase [Sporosarcina globispora]